MPMPNKRAHIGGAGEGAIEAALVAVSKPSFPKARKISIKSPWGVNMHESLAHRALCTLEHATNGFSISAGCAWLGENVKHFPAGSVLRKAKAKWAKSSKPNGFLPIIRGCF